MEAPWTVLTPLLQVDLPLSCMLPVSISWQRRRQGRLEASLSYYSSFLLDRTTRKKKEEGEEAFFLFYRSPAVSLPFLSLLLPRLSPLWPFTIFLSLAFSIRGRNEAKLAPPFLPFPPLTRNAERFRSTRDAATSMLHKVYES